MSSLHEALPSGGHRVIQTCACDASSAVSNNADSGIQQLSDATAGVAAILLHITEGDDPKSAHQKLHALLGSLGTGVQVKAPSKPREHAVQSIRCLPLEVHQACLKS